MRWVAVRLAFLQVTQRRLPRYAMAVERGGDPQTVHFRSVGGRRLRHVESVETPTPYFVASSRWLTPPASYSARIASLFSSGSPIIFPFQLVDSVHELACVHAQRICQLPKPRERH